MADRARVAQTLAAAAEGGDTGLLDRLCGACVRALSLEGAAISMMAAADRPVARSTSDERVTRIEELQFSLGEGPALAAFARREPVWAADLERPDRDWPVFAGEAAALVTGAGWPFRSVFAFPLQLGREPLGVVDLYRGEAGPMTPEVMAQARIAVDTAAIALLVATASATAAPSASADGRQALPPWLREAALDQVEVDQAVGMVMAQLELGPDEALARIRAHAFAEGTVVGVVARALTDRRLRFPREGL